MSVLLSLLHAAWEFAEDLATTQEPPEDERLMIEFEHLRLQFEAIANPTVGEQPWQAGWALVSKSEFEATAGDMPRLEWMRPEQCLQKVATDYVMLGAVFARFKAFFEKRTDVWNPRFGDDSLVIVRVFDGVMSRIDPLTRRMSPPFNKTRDEFATTRADFLIYLKE